LNLREGVKPTQKRVVNKKEKQDGENDFTVSKSVSAELDEPNQCDKCCQNCHHRMDDQENDAVFGFT
jgi:hypothetical protein